MSVKYVVSIAGTLLYFDSNRNPAPQLAPAAASEAHKPAVKLIPTQGRPAAGSEWDEALGGFSKEQRASAEISEMLGHDHPSSSSG